MMFVNITLYSYVIHYVDDTYMNIVLLSFYKIMFYGVIIFSKRMLNMFIWAQFISWINGPNLLWAQLCCAHSDG